MEWFGLIKRLLKAKRPQSQATAPELPVIAVIITSSIKEPVLEGAIRELLGSVRQSAHLVMYEWDATRLVEELEERDLAFIVIVDCLLDLEESCELLNAINSCAKLASIPFKTLTSLESSPADKKAAEIGAIEEMLLQVVASKRN